MWLKILNPVGSIFSIVVLIRSTVSGRFRPMWWALETYEGWEQVGREEWRGFRCAAAGLCWISILDSVAVVQMGVSKRCRSEKEDVLKVKEGGFGHEPEARVDPENRTEDNPEVVWTDPLVINLQPSGAWGGPTMNLWCRLSSPTCKVVLCLW